jgi:DNA-binding beta-propeller fold protein YncE
MVWLFALGVTVGTLAGSGALGMSDGPAAQASFVLPEGVAVDRSGDVYVADAAAQRIRKISHGVVSTVAGSGELKAGSFYVAGGYRDGPALTAQFNAPSGLAVGPSGELYIADRWNSCIRKLDRGVVSTFVGTCGHPGGADGSGAAAQFWQPLQLAYSSVDRAIYLADDGSGLRRIGLDGSVTTIATKLPKGSITGVAVRGDDLYVSAQNNGCVAHLRIDASQSEVDMCSDVLGNSAPYALAAADQDAVLFTDLVNNTVRLMRDKRTSVLSAPILDDAFDRQGSFRDGPAETASFNSPAGIAVAPNGDFYVADGLNRRIRTLSHLPPLDYDGNDPRQAAGLDSIGRERIAYVGDSLLWESEASYDSVATFMDAAFQSAANGAGVHARGFTMRGAPLDALIEFIENDLAGPANYVVLEINSLMIGDTYPGQNSNLHAADFPSWGPKAETLLRDFAAAMKDRGVHVTVVLQPSAVDYGPISGVHHEGDTDVLVPDYPRTWAHEQLLETVKTSGIDYIDLFPVYDAALRSDRSTLLFMTNNHHLAYWGRKLSGETIAREILKRLGR